ncbi:hypothetical protein [Vibrio crassostreae]|uniref:hypothetical protein n=1 Tax=Vibrio crassostreae TaxID=246167 RepID=UPI001BD60B99|nr:hypothetical protein [Vibrio crassostreae]
MIVIKVLSEVKHLSPEGRYLFLAIIFEQIHERYSSVDVSISRLRESFGVSHKVVSELLEYLQCHDLGVVTKVKHGKHKFTFDSVYLDSLKAGGFLSVHEAFFEVFSSKIQTVLKEKELKLRPSNLLLIGIFILHTNELGFIQSSTTGGNEERLSESKIRRLMGGINQGRLKSQLATLRDIEFIKSVAGGGVCPIYFGKFGKRYQVDLAFFSLKKSERKVISDKDTIKNVNGLLYETPECYLIYQTAKECSLKYEFDFELPFKLSFLMGKKINLHKRLEKTESKRITKTDFVDEFDLSRLVRDPFFRMNGLTLGILEKLEILTALILVSHWRSLTSDGFDKLDKLLESDSEVQQVVLEDSIFTQKYLNDSNDSGLLKDVHAFWKHSLLSLSLGLAMSLAKVIRGHCGQYADLKKVNLLMHDFQHYVPSKGKYPSCNISASYVVDETYYDLNIVSSKSHDSQTLRSGRLLDLDCDNRMIKEHIYSIWAQVNR